MMGSIAASQTSVAGSGRQQQEATGIQRQCSSSACSATELQPVLRGVDVRALSGLRGLLALHVAVFHFMYYSTLRWDLQGSPQMPWFFMLSGFTLTLVYGPQRVVSECPCGPWRCHTPTSRSTPDLAKGEGGRQSRSCGCSSGAAYRADSGDVGLGLAAFWQNRCARVAPLYYLMTVAGAAMAAVGHGLTPPTTAALAWAGVANTTFTTTLLVFAAGLNLDVPAWTICTLAVMWLFFPRLLAQAQRQTNDSLVRSMLRHFWLQLVLTALVFAAVFWLLPAPSGPLLAFPAATMHPLLRLPLFFMGIVAGVLRLRYVHGASAWLRCSCFSCVRCRDGAACAPGCVSPVVQRCSSGDAETDGHAWASVVDGHSALMALAFLVPILANILSGEETHANVWLQALVPLSQLSVLFALTLDDGRSWLGWLLRSPPAQALGNISLALYLCHFPVMNATTFILAGPVTWHRGVLDCQGEFAGQPAQLADCEKRTEQWFQAKLLPAWAIAPCLGAALLLACLLHVAVEAPLRHRCRARSSVLPPSDPTRPPIFVAATGGSGDTPGPSRSKPTKPNTLGSESRPSKVSAHPQRILSVDDSAVLGAKGGQFGTKFEGAGEAKQGEQPSERMLPGMVSPSAIMCADGDTPKPTVCMGQRAERSGSGGLHTVSGRPASSSLV